MEKIIIKRSDEYSWHLFLDNILIASFHEDDFQELSAYVLHYLTKLEHPPTLPMTEKDFPKSPFDDFFLKQLGKKTKADLIKAVKAIKLIKNDKKRI